MINQCNIIRAKIINNVKGVQWMIDAWTEDILFSGSKEEIDEVRCNCGGKLSYSYNKYGNFMIMCNSCASTMFYIKSPLPNCCIEARN